MDILRWWLQVAAPPLRCALRPAPLTSGATLSIANNDITANPYAFAIQGAGIPITNHLRMTYLPLTLR